MYKALIALIFLFSISCTSTKKTNSLTDKLDTILKAELQKPFNGVFLITQNGETICHKIAGFSNLKIKEPLTKKSEFVVGSISK
ncbi:MAG: hypothetical protein QMB03_06260 [Spirosomataceae bacterium]